MSAPISPENVARFVFAGEANFTLVSRSGNRHTFVCDKRRGATDQAPAWFVRVLTGPDNTSDYDYIGMFVDGELRLTRKSALSKDDPRVKGVASFLKSLVTKGLPPEWVAETWHDGRCGMCGRLLTVPESVATGLGPECSKKGKG
jgi:hypothetical protein